MAERIVSPGVFTRERDVSFLPEGIGDGNGVGIFEGIDDGTGVGIFEGMGDGINVGAFVGEIDGI